MKILSALFAIVLITSCKKNAPLPDSYIEIVDYATGNPIQGATVTRKLSSEFDFNCLCTTPGRDVPVGITAANGRIEHVNTHPADEISHPDYFLARQNIYSLFKPNGMGGKYSLFRKGNFLLKFRYDPNRYLEVDFTITPLLRDGSVAPGNYNRPLLYVLAPTDLPVTGFAMVTNRIAVYVQQYSYSNWVKIYETDVYLPETITKEVEIQL